VDAHRVDEQEVANWRGGCNAVSRFTEGFDTPDLREAKALLDTLA
jgi:hypothetical protein